MKISSIAVAACLTSCFAITVAVQAQETPPVKQVVSASGDAAQNLTLEEVQAKLTALEADQGIEDAVKALLRPKYQQATESLKAAAVNNGKAAEYRHSLDTAPQTAAEVRASLQALPSFENATGLTIPDGSADDLQKTTNSQKASLDGFKDQLSNATGALSEIKNRPIAISARLSAAQSELSECQTQLASPRLAEDVSSTGRVADLLMLQGQQIQLQSELEMLKQEQLSLSVREDLLQAQQELLTRQVENTSATVEATQKLMNERLASEVEKAGAAATLPDVPADDEEAQALAAEVQALVKEFETVAETRRQVTAAEGDLQKRMDRLTGEFDFISQGLKSGSSGAAMVQVLLDLRSEILDAKAKITEQSRQLSTYGETRGAAFRVDKRLRELPGLNKKFADRTSSAITQLLSSREDLLNKLETQYGNLVRDLASYDGSSQQYLDKMNEVRFYVKEQLVWMRSAPSISAVTLTEIPDSLKWEFSGEHASELGGTAQAMATQMPILIASIVLIVAMLLIMRRRIIAALVRTKRQVSRISTVRYVYTWEAMFWTLLLAIPLPLTLGSVGWLLAQNPEPSGWMRGIAEGLQFAAWITFTTSFMSAVCYTEGLGAAHFGWSKLSLNKIRQAASSFAAIYIPALLITFSTVYGEASHYFSSIGRISLMLADAWAAIVLWRLFSFSNGILATLVHEQPSRPIVRLRYIWFPLMIACPVALVVMSAVGYIFTSLDLGLGLIFTVAIISGGLVFYSMAERWFSIRTRSLALKKRHQETIASDEGPQAAGEVVTVDPDENQPDLESVDTQTRQLMQLLFSLGVLIAVVLFWSQTIPISEAINKLPIPLAGGLSLTSLIQAALILLVTYFVAKHLPAALELALARKQNINRGTRTAIATLCQYGVVALGFLLLVGVLDVDWTRFGWIAAALSVGLGFGLQEVVANFVCGLILLFERPIRIGDVVTLEGLTGTVTNIRMRATTIINWDRQEFVVPNKNIITGSILNWTLSTSLTRIVIPVGVAYGSDTEEARQILLDVAADHPLILCDPPAMTTFEAFADSSLTLTLRAYLPDVDDRIKTITELHTEIDKRFADAGIEIAFPQRDLNLRSGWTFADKLAAQGEGSGSTSAENGDATGKSQTGPQRGSV